jgi:hypothetical protein
MYLIKELDHNKFFGKDLDLTNMKLKIEMVILSLSFIKTKL